MRHLFYRPESHVHVGSLPLPEAVLADLGGDPRAWLPLDLEQAAAEGRADLLADAASALIVAAGSAPPDAAATARPVLALAEHALLPDGRLVVTGSGDASLEALARLRDGLWPELHVQRAYRFVAGGAVERIDHGGSRALVGRADGAAGGWALLASWRRHALSPEVTQEKFDGTAAGWNGDPARPDYGHFRWMRRLVAACARPRRGERVLDAGCGAGWVGLEAARLGADVSAFDPSPEMVRIAQQNAAALGVALDARVGFVERPPFEEPFALVLNSGVISFAPDPDDYLAGLDRMVAPGGRLVIGDLNPRSRGFCRRRRERPVLPSRELNALPRGEVEALLERRGYEIEWRRYYQLTTPAPQLVHRSKSRLTCGVILALNRALSALDAALGARAARFFDSWLIGARKRGT